MLKVVLDTNVLISAVLFGGNPRKILYRVIRGNIKLCISEQIIDELKRVLKRPKFGFSPEIIQLIVNELIMLSEFIIPRIKIDVIQVDPEDNKILECATEGGANYIITGDIHLLELQSFKEIKIVNPAKFIEEVST